MCIKVIIFALDGVICHLEKYHYLAWKQIADELEIPFTIEYCHKLTGLSRMDSLNKILENSSETLSQAEKEILAEQKNVNFRNYLTRITENDCISGLRDFLQELKKSGYLVAIASSSKNTGILLRRMNLEDCIEVVSDGNTSVRLKPNPEVFLNICEYAQVSPKECLIVEGTNYGIQAGISAGIRTIGIDNNLCFSENIKMLSDILELRSYLNI